MADLPTSGDEAVAEVMSNLSISQKPPHPAPLPVDAPGTGLPKAPPGVIPLSGPHVVSITEPRRPLRQTSN